MKQGRASLSSVSATKVEPKTQLINPGAVSQLGIHNGPQAPLISGKGVQAPMVGQTNHKAGSQGRH